MPPADLTRRRCGTSLRATATACLALVMLSVVNAAEAPVKPRGEPSEIFGALVYFHRALPGSRMLTGSGCLVRTASTLLLVTAAHVAADFTDGGSITLRGADGNGKSFTLEEVVGRAAPFVWTKHEHADVAVLRLDVSKTPRNGRDVSLQALDLDFFSKDRAAPGPRLLVGIVGFPLALVPLEGPFSPVEKDTAVASALLGHPRLDTGKPTTFLLVQDAIAGGFSGAPVFTLKTGYLGGTKYDLGGIFAAAGIVHGTLGDNTGAKFGAITPAVFVRETIDAALASGQESKP